MEGRAADDRERKMRWTLGALHFLVIASFTWARIVRDGLLLSRLSVEWVPWLTVAVLVAAGLAAPLLARTTRHLSPVRAFARVAIATGVSLLGWELLLRTRSDWSAMALYVWVGTYGPLLVAQFWIVVHHTLDAEQARAHIGWVGACGILGGIA
jgi:ATP/ADP translocase